MSVTNHNIPRMVNQRLKDETSSERREAEDELCIHPLLCPQSHKAKSLQRQTLCERLVPQEAIAVGVSRPF